MRGLDAIFLGFLVLLLIPVVRTDLEQRRIPNWTNCCIAAAGLAYQMISSPHLSTLGLNLLMAAITIGVLLLVSWLARKATNGAQIGLGDLKFLAASSLWVGMDGSFLVLLLASLLMLGIELALAPWRGIRWNTPRPFGPLLAASLLIIVSGIFVHRSINNSNATDLRFTVASPP